MLSLGLVCLIQRLLFRKFLLVRYFLQLFLLLLISYGYRAISEVGECALSTIRSEISELTSVSSKTSKDI